MSEFDSSAAVFKSRAKDLAALMATGGERTFANYGAPMNWRPSFGIKCPRRCWWTFGQLLMCAPPPGCAHARAMPKGLLLKSFGDLFHHPAPVVELLELVEGFCESEPGSSGQRFAGRNCRHALLHQHCRRAGPAGHAHFPIIRRRSAARAALDAWKQTWLDEKTKELARTGAGRNFPDDWKERRRATMSEETPKENLSAVCAARFLVHGAGG